MNKDSWNLQKERQNTMKDSCTLRDCLHHTSAIDILKFAICMRRTPVDVVKNNETSTTRVYTNIVNTCHTVDNK